MPEKCVVVRVDATYDELTELSEVTVSIKREGRKPKVVGHYPSVRGFDQEDLAAATNLAASLTRLAMTSVCRSTLL